MGQPEIDLFLSRLSNQLPAYYSWKPDSNSLALDALQQTWYTNTSTLLSLFTDRQGTKEGRIGERPFFGTDSTNLAEPDMVPRVNSFVNEKSSTLTSTFKPLKEPSRETYNLLQNQTMRLIAWIITGNIWLRKEFQKGLQTLSFRQEERVLTQIIVRPGISGLAGVINRKSIHFDVL